jgi:hypothetical protein
MGCDAVANELFWIFLQQMGFQNFIVMSAPAAMMMCM